MVTDLRVPSTAKLELKSVAASQGCRIQGTKMEVRARGIAER